MEGLVPTRSEDRFLVLLSKRIVMVACTGRSVALWTGVQSGIDRCVQSHS